MSIHCHENYLQKSQLENLTFFTNDLERFHALKEISLMDKKLFTFYPQSFFCFSGSVEYTAIKQGQMSWFLSQLHLLS